MLLILGVAIVLLSILTALALFGDSPSFRDSFIAKIRLMMIRNLNKLTTYYDAVDDKCAGKLSKYLGWIVPIFYFALITICLCLFFNQTYDILPETVKASFVHYFAIRLTILSLYTSFILATFSDPGIINSDLKVDKACQLFSNNDLIFFEGKNCYTCHRTKPARSKHCSVCGVCVALWDHHCIWINNCVGYYNYRWFLLYLFSNILFLGYGAILCYWTLQRQARYGNWWNRIIASTEANKTTGIFLILCSIFVIVATIFTMFHIRYLYLGVTTNECEKWSEIEYLVRTGTLYRAQSSSLIDEPYVEKGIINDRAQYSTAFISLKDERVITTDISGLEKVQSVESDLINIYDRGFWGNVKERVLNVHKLDTV